MFNRTHYWAIRHASVIPTLTNEWAPERSLAVIYISHFVLVLSLLMPEFCLDVRVVFAL